MEIRTNFTDEDMVNFFRSSGLNVEKKLEEQSFPKLGLVKTYKWRVQNPYTNQWEDMYILFKILYHNCLKRMLFDSFSKLDVIGIFKR